MRDSEKMRLAASVVDLHYDLQEALAASRKKYPIREFQLFAQAVRNYATATRRHALIHRDVVKAVNDLRIELENERKTVPGEVLVEADRLECLIFLGYDPYFEGDEPPGL